MDPQTHDRERYEKEVLAPARHKGLPTDLFVRYGIDARHERRLSADPRAFATHVEQMCTYWRGLQARRRALRKVLVDLVAAHERLDRAGLLSHAHFVEVREELLRRAEHEWTEMADHLTTSRLEAAEFHKMLDPVGLDEPRALEILRDKGVHVVHRFPELPVSAPVATFTTLRDNLRTCEVDFSPEVVFGTQRLEQGFTVVDGFRLVDGGRVDEHALDAAVDRLQVEAHSGGRSAAENVLSILRAAGGTARRDAVVLWEVVTDLRERPVTVSETALVRAWTRKGLDQEEARLLAAAVRHAERRPDPARRAEEQVRALLADNLLRQAQSVAAALPGDHELREELRKRAERVEELVRQAERALRDGASEEAAHALSEAVAGAADDTVLADRLSQVPPVAPRSVSARVDGRRVVISWVPGSEPSGALGHRVVRVTGRGGAGRETPIADLSGTETVDEQAPVGTEVRYFVQSVREGPIMSTPVFTVPVILTPEVEDLHLCVDERQVLGTWKAPGEAVRVEVLRAEGAPPRGPGDGTPVPVDGAGFTDTSVCVGREYFYRVRALYLTSSGQGCGSEGIVRRAAPLPRPRPVTDLEVVRATRGVVVSWTCPPGGRVALWVGQRPPRWRSGQSLSTGELADFGREVVETPVLGPRGRAHVSVRVPAGVCHVLAVTVGTDRIVAGDRIRLVSVPAVENLRAERLDTTVRLSWEWPEHTAQALILWRAGSVAGAAGPERFGQVRCARQQYERDGGFEVDMGTDEVEVSVHTVTDEGAEESVSAPVTVTVPGRTVLDYRVETVGVLRRERVVHLTAVSSGPVPEIVVVHCPGLVQPYSATQGQVLAVFAPGPRAAGEHVSVRVHPPRGQGPAWLMCFPRGEGAQNVRLRQPSVKELRL